MKNQTLQLWAQAEEVAAEVEVAEQFTVWSVADEAALEGLLTQIGWEQWAELQAYAERHAEVEWRCLGRRVA